MTASHHFDPAHDDAIRAVLSDIVRETPHRKPGRRAVLFVAIAAACILAIGGGGYAFASLHQAPGDGGSAAVPPAPSATSKPSSPRPASPEPSSSPTAPENVEPASTPTPTPLPVPITAATIKTPVILTPTEGQVFPASAGQLTTVVYSGTGTPGANIYLAIDCVVPGHPDECSSAEEYGQPWQPPLIVGADGTWSLRTTYEGGPDTIPEKEVLASSALNDRDGNTLHDSTGALIQTGPSVQITFYVGRPAS